jgi:hypothetical protein
MFGRKASAPQMVRQASANMMTSVNLVAPTLMRHGSQMFFLEEKSEKPVYKRGIFWVFAILGLAGSAFTAYLLSVYVKSELDAQLVSGDTSYSIATAPPTSWGTDGNNTACPFGGCTHSPTTSVTVPG